MAKETKAKEKKVAPKASVKGFYHYIKQAWKKPTAEHITEVRKKMIDWRASDRITKIEKPTRLDRARVLGYKAKQGIYVFRVTLERGGRAKARPTTKRRSKRFGVMKILRMNYQWVAEQRVQRKHMNLEVLSSYLLGQDGQHAFFEVIAVDPHAPQIKSDKTLNWICKPENRNRALRGLTSSARKSRGLRVHSRRLKVRPSLRAWNRQGR
jgi:large subunit ribosomal protein L15e